MQAAVIWIDREIGKIFFFSEKRMERVIVKGTHIEHNSHKTNNLDIQRQDGKLFEDLISHLRQIKSILILGPGVAKYHFRNFLNEHHPAIGRSVVGCEAADHPTDSEIAAYATKYFLAKKIPMVSNG